MNLRLILIFTTLVACVSFGLRAQNTVVVTPDQVPQVVREAFARDFPGMTAVKWEQHGTGRMAKAYGGKPAEAAARAEAAGKLKPRYVAVFDIASTEVAPATPTNKRGQARKPRQVKTRSRARYTEAGELVFQQVHHPGPVVPPTVSSATLAANPGYRLDWATELKNVKKNQHIFVLRCSKASPKEVRKFFVNPDGSAVTEANVPDDAKEIEDKD